MWNKNKFLLFSILLPIFALVFLICFKHTQIMMGKEVTLPISGYDPRDLLSGHYLRYSIDYNIMSICKNNEQPVKSSTEHSYVCLEPRFFSLNRPFPCTVYIRGYCQNGRFIASIEQFFIPEDKAKILETLIQTKKSHIVLSVTSHGQAYVKELFIEGKPWHKWNLD
jgi:uncharacterized membrane-anchored protein